MDQPLDYRQQFEEERMLFLLAILQKVKRGMTTEEDARALASELGLTNYYEKEQH